jgi:hypothetical protein
MFLGDADDVRLVFVAQCLKNIYMAGKEVIPDPAIRIEKMIGQHGVDVQHLFDLSDQKGIGRGHGDDPEEAGDLRPDPFMVVGVHALAQGDVADLEFLDLRRGDGLHAFFHDDRQKDEHGLQLFGHDLMGARGLSGEGSGQPASQIGSASRFDGHQSLGFERSKKSPEGVATDVHSVGQVSLGGQPIPGFEIVFENHYLELLEKFCTTFHESP